MNVQDDNSLAKKLGYDTLPEDQKATCLAQFHESLHTRIGLAVQDALTDEQLEQFTEIAEKGDDTATQTWIEQNVSGYDELIAAETEALKKELLETTEAIRQGMRQADVGK